MSVKVPILLVAFNRPDTTEVVFEKIRAAKPLKLYVAVDNARANKAGEDKLVKQVQEIVQKVDWPCETHYFFNDKNLGAEITVSSAINWVLEKEEYLIVLEDDIVAPIAFFQFVEEMLIKYKDDPRIGLVSGCNYTPMDKDDNDYLFVKYGHTQGWGTWKRVWEKFDLDIEMKEEHLKKDFLIKISNSRKEMNYYRKYFHALKKNGPGKSTWDQISGYIFRINNYMTIIPRVNLTSNIGIYGLHANGATENHFRPYDDKFIVKTHPKDIEYDVEYDKVHFKFYINKKQPFFKQVVRKILKSKIIRMINGI